MSQSNSGGLFSLMSHIEALAEEAIQYLCYHHRHRTIHIPDCPECVMRQKLLAIKEEAEKVTQARD